MPLVYQPTRTANTLLSLPRLKKLLDQAGSDGTDSAQSIAELRRSHVQAMRLLLRSQDSALMAQFLSLQLIDSDMCRRLFLEVNPSGFGMRRVVMEYILHISQTAASGNRPTDDTDINSHGSVPLPAESQNPVPPEMNSPAEVSMPNYIEGLRPDVSAPADWIRRSTLRLGLREPSLRIILEEMPVKEDPEVYPAGTDRRNFFIPSEWKIVSIPDELSRQDLFLHMIIHCLFGHMKVPENVRPDLWDLACDISAEFLRKEFFPWSGDAADPKLPSDVHPEDASAVYQYLIHGRSHTDSFSSKNLCVDGFSRRESPVLPDCMLFRRDDHSVWYRTADISSAPGPSEHEWQEALQLHGHSASHRRGFAPGSREDKILLREAAKNDFRSYLRRFSSIREEIQPDYDSFDYIPYYYGTLLNPDMPLLEPLEYTEANKVDQLAIAIDTSGSCDLPTIQSFLAEVHGILTHRESFFRKMEVHIFQCDSVIQEHTVIRSSEMWENYIRDITIHGRGGTDFSPVFREIQRIRDDGGLARLKGLIYFSDGDGVYPREKPPYETAFVFTTDQFRRYLVPDWIIPLTMNHYS